MAFKIHSHRTNDASSAYLPLIDGATYVVVGLHTMTAKLGGENKSFYKLVLGRVENNKVVALESLSRAEFLYNERLPRHDVDGKKYFPSGTAIAEASNVYFAQKGLVDLIWAKYVLPAIAGKQFTVTSEVFTARSRKNTLYTARVYKADYVEKAKRLKFKASDLQDLAKQTVVGFDKDLNQNILMGEVVGFDYEKLASESFIDADGKQVQD